MTLKEQQCLFMTLLPRLVDKINETCQCTGGQLQANPEYHEHMNNSCHYVRLAIDLNLFDKAGNFLDTSEAHRPFGEFWESLHPLCRWGGRFGDGNHYSMEYQGRK